MSEKQVTVKTFDLVRAVGGWPIDLDAVGTLLERLRRYGGYDSHDAIPMDREWTESELLAADVIGPEGGE